ncbi:hypothetical protein NLG97_g4431 [Lecanicillium saksenae]|uniref:Uncharacterized protein n=1 Tax=Lecanicillium saksenae TaxID=468837 RepID=A0ACC1QWN5_9HYPO|nr:hypothetical protein NLG97_g4431 [Lecanicillium saksenae]
MRLSQLIVFPAATRAAIASHHGKMDNLVIFGDSLSDDWRAHYVDVHHQLPPPGTMLPPTHQASSGGALWGEMVVNMTGARYYNYAFSGGTCSLGVASQPAGPPLGRFPTILEYEVPAFEADLAFPSLYPNRHPGNTVYAVWIGTNDLGVQGYLLDQNVPGKTLDDLVSCVYTSFDRIYASGGRRFVIMNEAPLDKAPMYKSLENGGQGDNPIFRNKTQYNTTQFEHKMFHYVEAVNSLFDYSAPFHLRLKRRWPGASITIFDLHLLFNDISENPQQYLDSPYNVTSSYKICDADNHCTLSSSWPPSSFLWYDGLHVTERAHEIIAKEFVSAVNGTSKFATTY